MAHFNNMEIVDAIAHHKGGIDADNERDEIEKATAPGNTLDRCNKDPVTCDRKQMKTTPYCHQCQVLPNQ